MAVGLSVSISILTVLGKWAANYLRMCIVGIQQFQCMNC